MRGDRRHALPLDEQVEQAAGEDAGVAHHADVVGQDRVEGQQGAGVDGDGVALELDEEDIMGRAGEEDLALAVDAHEVAALVGQGLLDHAAQAPGALVGEVDIALVGDHRPLSGDHLGAHDHPEHFLGLEDPALGGLLLLKRLVEDGAAHDGAFPVGNDNRRMVQGRSPRRNGEGIPLRERAGRGGRASGSSTGECGCGAGAERLVGAGPMTRSSLNPRARLLEVRARGLSDVLEG